MNIRSLIVVLPLVAFSHSLVAMAAVPGNVRSVFPARGTVTGPMGGARVSALADGAVRVDAGLKERWTGLVVKFDGAQDFTSFQRLQSVISNCLDHPVNLCMSVWSAKGHRDQNETLPPNGVYRITVPMVPGGTLLDKAVDLVGMKGVPQPAETDSFDVSRVTAVNIVLGGAPTRQESFTLLSMTARGEVAKVSAEGFFPFVDRYVRVETVYRAAAAFCDVVSLNVYRYAPYEDLPEGSADKPIIIGAHWFQWWDQVLTARCDGENFQCGFLSITDTPYRELVEAARDIARRMYGLRYGRGR